MLRSLAMFLLLLILAAANPVRAHAQSGAGGAATRHGARPEAAFDPAGGVLSFGAGLGTAGLYGSSSMPAISATYDRGVGENVSIGGFAGYSASTVHDSYYSYYGYDWGWKYSYALVGVRGDYHFTEWLDHPRLDAYAGVMLGYNHVTARAFAANQTGAPASASYALYGAHAGGRYFFTPRMGAFAEVGYGVGAFAAGLSIKM